MRVLVLCAGNIGRSPLAEAMLRHGLAVGLGVDEEDLGLHGVFITSAGTDAPEGRPASRRGIDFASERDLNMGGHTATQMTAEAVAAADLVFCMDRHQVAAVAALNVAEPTKVELLAGEGEDIPDPHHESDQFFYDVAVRIERAVAARMPELLEMVRSSPPEE